ncbi:hypothetical protein DOY81_007373, partial [Sarcophaga bullata]
MIYIRLKLFSFLLLLTQAKTHLDLRERLARLLLDPDYSDKENELERPRKTYGMLLKDLREQHLFDTSSEEEFFELLSRLGEHYDDIRVSSARKPAPSTESSTTTTTTTTSATTTTTTTTTQPSTITMETTEKTPLLGQSQRPLVMGIGRLGIM